MAAEGKLKATKYLMYFFNFLFWLSGFILMITGTIIKFKYGEVINYADVRFANAGIFLLAIGFIVMFIGFIGWLGAMKEDYCMVSTFAVLLCLVVILEFTACVLGFSYRADVKRVATKTMVKTLRGYSTYRADRLLIDWVQHKFKCCGIKNAHDFDSQKKKGATCGRGHGVTTCHVGSTCKGRLYAQGCKAAFIKYIKSKLVVIGMVAVIIASVQLFGIVFSCSLMKALKGGYAEIMNQGYQPVAPAGAPVAGGAAVPGKPGTAAAGVGTTGYGMKSAQAGVGTGYGTGMKSAQSGVGTGYGTGMKSAQAGVGTGYGTGMKSAQPGVGTGYGTSMKSAQPGAGTGYGTSMNSR